MPRKKGWYRAKRKAEEEKCLQAAGFFDNECCSLPKKHFTDHTYHKEEFVEGNDSQYENIFLHCHDIDKKEEINPVIYDYTGVGETVEVTFDHFDNMYCELTKSVKQPYTVTNCTDAIKIVEMYDLAMKLCVIIKKDFTLQLYVHNRLVSKTNAVFHGITDGQLNVDTIMKFLNRLKASHVCFGNAEAVYVMQVLAGSGLSVAVENRMIAYLELGIDAKIGDVVYQNNVRSTDCQLILNSKKERCIHCMRVRGVLRQREYIRKEKKLRPKKSYLHSTACHSQMDRKELLDKLTEQRNKIKSLEKENLKLEGQVKDLTMIKSAEEDKTQSSSESEVAKAFPDSNSFQRLFWEQQLKEAKSGKCGMRWHPVIVQWCLYLQQTSTKCFKALQESGFFKLPSSRTLYEYRRNIKSADELSTDVIQMLKNEAAKNGMYEESLES